LVDPDPLKYAVPIPVYLLSFEVFVDADPEKLKSAVDVGRIETIASADPERRLITPDPT
jgi:hypothetical protein